MDRNPHKQGRFLPGSHIPIHHPDHIRETTPRLRADPSMESEG
ncbi:MAG: hypothetical protein ACLPND_23940 [Candidatus Korobacteraceae bacterium]